MDGYNKNIITLTGAMYSHSKQAVYLRLFICGMLHTYSIRYDFQHIIWPPLRLQIHLLNYSADDLSPCIALSMILMMWQFVWSTTSARQLRSYQ